MMTDVEKAVFWIHGNKCRILVFTFDGQVVDNDDSWNNRASAQSYIFHKYGFGIIQESVSGDTKRLAELNAIFDARMSAPG